MECALAFQTVLLFQPKDLFGVEPESQVLVLGLLLSLCKALWGLRASVSSSPDMAIGPFCGSNEDNGHESIVTLTARLKKNFEAALMVKNQFQARNE